MVTITGTINICGYSPINHRVQVGAADGQLTSVNPSTSGLALISNGPGSDPSFQSVSVAGAVTSLTADSGSATPTAGAIPIRGGTTGLTTIGSAGAITITGTLGTANGGTGTATTFTQSSVVFAGASGVYSQNNSQFFWDNTNNVLGVGTGTPDADAKLHVRTSGIGGDKGLFIDNFGVGAGYGMWMQLSSDIANPVYVTLRNSVGGEVGNILYNTGTGFVDYNTTSDRRVKKDIRDADKLLDAVLSLRPRYFKMYDNPNDSLGFIADEIQETALSKAVTGEALKVDENGNDVLQSVNFNYFIPALVGAIKELHARIMNLESKI